MQIVMLWSSILGVGELIQNSKSSILRSTIPPWAIHNMSWTSQSSFSPGLSQILNKAKLTFRRDFLQELSRPADKQIYITMLGQIHLDLPHQPPPPHQLFPFPFKSSHTPPIFHGREERINRWTNHSWDRVFQVGKDLPQSSKSNFGIIKPAFCNPLQ